MIGCYSICYSHALTHGVNPGVLAIVLGIQPILTLVLLERRFTATRALGLGVALCGLILVMYQSLLHASFRDPGVLFAIGALISITLGSILQKRIHQAPMDVLPMQY